MFSVMGIVIGKADIMPKSFSEFMGNLLLYKLSYNGAWWYVTTYVFLLLLQPVIYKIVKKSSIGTIAAVCISYILGCGFRFYGLCPQINNVIIDWILRQFGLLMYAMSGYMIGMYFAKAMVITRLKQLQNKINKKLYIPIYIISVVVLIILHGFIQSVVFAIVTGVAFICIFNIWNKGKTAKRVFWFLGKHSTNIWLTHMFFYSNGRIFEGLVFKARYPIFVFAIMMILCIASSYVILWIIKLVEKVRVCKK